MSGAENGAQSEPKIGRARAERGDGSGMSQIGEDGVIYTVSKKTPPTFLAVTCTNIF